MEVVNNVQYINVYYVRKIYDSNTYLWSSSSSIRRPQNIIEVYLTESEAVQRTEVLANQQNDYPYLSKISTSKQLAITTDNGKTVTILDMLNTLKISQL
jgi:hypothetical protein